MTVCIFLGPSLAADEALAVCPAAHLLPPVQQGDIYSAVQHFKPKAIGIIDGYFQHSPSVWHKEILWAMTQGVHVVGAASMGALRAAELEAFGMTGVGLVFEAYRSGAMPPFRGVTDDDEVAVTHGPAETGYIAISDAMVNIRHTLEAATQHQIIDKYVAQALIREAKQLHFPERKYSTMLEQARINGVCTESLDRLHAWLPTGKIDQKRADARLLIEYIQLLPGTNTPAHTVNFHFETTEIWCNALASMSAKFDASAIDAHHQQVLDELRLDEHAYADIKREAFLRLVVAESSCNLSARHQLAQEPIADHYLRRLVDDFRRINQLPDRSSIDKWLAASELATADFDDLIRREAQVELLLSTPDTTAGIEAAIDCLRIQGIYPALSVRARRKSAVLTGSSTPQPPAPQLLQWYFENHRNQPVPLDVDAYARRLGLEDDKGFLNLISREYQYLNESRVDNIVPTSDS